MGYAELIYRELESLPLDKQVEVLDFIGYLKIRQNQTRENAQKTADEIEAFFRGFNVDVRGYKFDREDANAS
jgi:hypothetical protein